MLSILESDTFSIFSGTQKSFTSMLDDLKDRYEDETDPVKQKEIVTKINAIQQYALKHPEIRGIRIDPFGKAGIYLDRQRIPSLSKEIIQSSENQINNNIPKEASDEFKEIIKPYLGISDSVKIGINKAANAMYQHPGYTAAGVGGLAAAGGLAYYLNKRRKEENQ